jgi:hypothetical protein
MKVINKIVIALALAVPFTLVAADELVIENNINALTLGTAKYSPDMHEALTISPIGYEHIQIVPPGYDKPTLSEANTLKNGIGLQNVKLPLTGEIAASNNILIP